MQTSPSSAKAAGDKYYFTGKACPRGHVCNRFASTHACIGCVQEKKAVFRASPENRRKEVEKGREYNRINAEALKSSRLAKYKADPSKSREATNRWKAKNKAHLSAYATAYKKAYPGENAARAAKYLANRRAATPPWADLEAIQAIYVSASRLTRETGIRHEVDHIHPLSGKASCGLHVPYNLRPIPERQNRTKYNKLLEVD